jgi:hypothetical protein
MMLPDAASIQNAGICASVSTFCRMPRDCRKVGGTSIRAVRPVGRYAGWGMMDGLGVAVGRNGLMATRGVPRCWRSTGLMVLAISGSWV